MKYVNTTCFTLLLLLTACAAPWQTNLLQGVKGKAELIKEVNTPPEYRIQAGDELSIKIRTLSTNEIGTLLQSLSKNQNNIGEGLQTGVSRGLSSYSVDESGRVEIPYIGRVQVIGLTIVEIKLLIEKMLFDIIKESSVEIFLINNSFTAMGELGSGTIPLPKEQTNIYEALALTGKISAIGDRARIKLIRQTPNGVIIKTFNLKSKDIISSEFFWIQPNDIIYIKPLNGSFWGTHTSIYSIMVLVTTAISITTLSVKILK